MVTGRGWSPVLDDAPPLEGLVSLDRLVFLGNVPAGMDWSVIGYWSCQFRKSGEQGPPVLVVPIGTTGLLRVTDGRHRIFAAYIAGRTHIAYATDPDRDPEPDPGPLLRGGPGWLCT